MAPFVEDQQRTDAAPEQPPLGAMSYGEFVRSRSDDSQLSMVKLIINRLLENEDRTAQTREAHYRDMRNGTINATDGFLSILGNDRNATCHRIGFLVGYATAIGMESAILTKVQSEFAENWSYAPNLSRVVGNTHDRGEMNGDEEMTEASEASEETKADDSDDESDDNEASGSEDVDGTDDANTAVTTNGSGGMNGDGDAGGEDDSPVGGVMVDSEA